MRQTLAAGRQECIPMKADFGSPGQLARHIALLALIALCNPYTLFGRDPDRSYWLAAFLVPLLLAGLLVLASARRSGPFARLSWQLLALVLALQWIDV